MSEKRDTSAQKVQEERRKRVKRIKNIIITIVIVCLLTPSICCVTLWIKVAKMERQLNEIERLQEDTSEKIESDENTVEALQEKKNDKVEDVASSEKDVQEELEHSKIKGKKVYLTFDDGPSKNTEKILDILMQYEIKATFFVIGKTDDFSQKMYKRIYEEGHTLAMHSYTHQYKTIYRSLKDYEKDITELSDLLYNITGERTKFIRFPGGSSNEVSNVDMKEIIRYTNREGYIYFDWNVINGDATGQKLTVKEMVNNVISGVDSYDTSIVLMHDCEGKELTVKSLPKIIKKLQKMETNILPINSTTTPIQHVKAESVK